jgi:Ca2+-binding EF-hand superfamily protein
LNITISHPGPAPPSSDDIREATPDDLHHLKVAFNAMDKNRDGFVVESELREFFAEVGLGPSFAPLVIRIFDRGRRNSLTFDDFLEYMEAMANLGSDPRRFFRTVFNAIDQDNSGFIDAGELARFALLLQVTMSPEEAAASIAAIDTDQNGKIDFDELCNALGI